MSINSGTQDIQSRIRGNLEELEEKIESGKMHWNQCNQILDPNIFRNFIEVQYNEILHHLSEAKHHLQQITYHEQILEITCSKHVKMHKQETESCQLAQPLKYWEKVMQDQNLTKNAVIKRRPKKHSESIARVPKIMVKNRVEQFEGMQKCKRISSTIEPFLEYKYCRPVDSNAYDDDVAERETPSIDCCCCSHKKDVSHVNLVKSLDIGFEDIQACCCSYSDKNVNSKSYQCAESLIQCDCQQSESGASDKCENLRQTKSEIIGEEVWDEKYEHKPRIVEMHYKQPSNSPGEESPPDNSQPVENNTVI